MAEGNFSSETINLLRARGHSVEVSGNWTIGRLTAAKRSADGVLKAAATPRLMQAYAIGR
jgi:gamma-glutamyltranspeptidase/glutathione hydrolase